MQQNLNLSSSPPAKRSRRDDVRLGTSDGDFLLEPGRGLGQEADLNVTAAAAGVERLQGAVVSHIFV